MNGRLGGFDPDTYPGWRAEGPALVHAGRLHPVGLGPSFAALRAPVEAAVFGGREIHWSVAHGSNACPDRLVDKGLDERGAVLLPARLHGWAPAFEARRSPLTGAVPVTLVPAPGRVSDVWLLGIHPDDQEALDDTEGRGERYVVGRVGTVEVAERWRLSGVPAYGPAAVTRVLRDGDEPALFPDRDQAWAAARQDAAGPSLPVAPLPGLLERGWVAPTIEEVAS